MGSRSCTSTRMTSFTSAEDETRSGASAGIAGADESRYERHTMDLSATHPVGSDVTTTVYGIGGRSESVTGQVVDYRRNSVVVETEWHGRIVVERGKVDNG